MTQYHFTSWPDHGVPRFATSLISFLRRVQKTHNKDSGVPLLVHCSAGVGRTGTFILLDSMLEQIKEQNSINVYEFLVSLRERRVLMVQTLVRTIHGSYTNGGSMVYVFYTSGQLAGDKVHRKDCRDYCSNCRRSMCLSTMHCVRSSSVETQRSQPPD